jgi:Tol biopolymer transport system component
MMLPLSLSRCGLLTSAVFCVLTTGAGAIDLRVVYECSSPSSSVYCIVGEPSLSPDGQCIAFTSATTYPPWYEYWPGIGVLGIDGANCNLPAINTPNNWVYAPAWSPDGSKLAFVADGYGPSLGLWTVAASDATDPPDSGTHLVTGMARDPAWSMDGALIAYVQDGVGIHVVPSTGGTPLLLVSNGSAPAWGPNGQLAFVRNGDLWVRAQNGTERRLTTAASYETTPAWSPQGLWIAYASDSGGTWGIWVVAAHGGTPVRVTPPEMQYVGHPTWSGDGTRLVFSGTSNGQDAFWLATNLPDWTIAVEPKTWGDVKQLYR